MDFNDLNSRLKRLYSALDEQYDEDVSSNIVDERKRFRDGRFEYRTTFGTNTLQQNQNLIMGILHLIASLKDIIQKKIKDAGGNPKDYDALINNTESLALITDLDNMDKHGDPLTKTNRSNKNPKIVNIEQGLRGKGITSIGFITDLNTGKTSLSSTEGDVKIVVTADIIDSSNNTIMPLDIMIDDSISAINTYLENTGIPKY